MQNMRNAIQDGINIFYGSMKTRDFTNNFIDGTYHKTQIIEMLSTPCEYKNLAKFKKAPKKSLILELGDDYERLLREYFANQQSINFLVLKGLYDVAYEHDASDTKYVTQNLRVNSNKVIDPLTEKIKDKPEKALEALEILHTIFNDPSKRYIKTLPNFALYNIFRGRDLENVLKIPNAHLNKSAHIERFPGYDPKRPQGTVTKYLVSAILEKDIKKIKEFMCQIAEPELITTTGAVVKKNLRDTIKNFLDFHGRIN